MTDALPAVFLGIERFSRAAILLTVTFFGLLRLTGTDINLPIQIVIATVALFLGIPHGAIDHLISIPRSPTKRFYAYITIYLIFAFLAGAAIAHWNLLGFQLIVILSSLHFGFGDASYRKEWRPSGQTEKFPWLVGTLYAVPAGFAPVILPLTDPRSSDALGRIRPALQQWAGLQTGLIRNITLAVTVIALFTLLAKKKTDFGIDLALLMSLSLTAPPLVAFATYFGFWHAARHTARLVHTLPRARSLASAGKGARALWAAIAPGLYALVGSVAIASALMVWDRGHFGSGLLWSALVLVWALTVPHMLSTARFDLRALKK